MSVHAWSMVSAFMRSPNCCCFLPRCMECRRGLVMRILSVRPSVCLSYVCIVTKQKKNLSRFLYRVKDHLACLVGATPSS